MTTIAMSASAQHWGALWGDRPATWAATEERQRPACDETLRHLPVGPGDHVLDLGCATGVFLRLCADRGATVSGVDAAERLLAVAAARVPEADLRLADPEQLPHDDDTFDLVAGFASFFFADDVVAALAEAGRVARPGAPVVVGALGDRARRDLPAMDVANQPPAVSVEELLPQAGLGFERSFDISWAYAYPGPEAVVEAMLAVGGAAAGVDPVRELELRAAILRALTPCLRLDGSYRVSNEWHVVIARA